MEDYGEKVNEALGTVNERQQNDDDWYSDLECGTVAVYDAMDLRLCAAAFRRSVELQYTSCYMPCQRKV